VEGPDEVDILEFAPRRGKLRREDSGIAREVFDNFIGYLRVITLQRGIEEDNRVRPVILLYGERKIEEGRLREEKGREGEKVERRENEGGQRMMMMMMMMREEDAGEEERKKKRGRGGGP